MYINAALDFIAAGLDGNNVALRTKNKWALKDLKGKLLKIKADLGV